MQEQSFSDYTFDELDINQTLKRRVQDMGFVNMTPIQEQAIPLLLEGYDVVGQAQTGTGKTAAFGLPILNKINPEDKSLQALILCPTRELAMQAANDLRNYSMYIQGLKVLPIYGGQDINKQIKDLKGVQVVVGTPGRIMDHMRRRTIKLDNVSMVILDEADEMFDMGFREDMEIILGAIDHVHQTCLFSATMPEEILNLANTYQVNPKFVKITKKELTIDSIEQYYYGIKREYKYEALKRLMMHYQYSKCIIFCNTKTMVDELTKLLQNDGFNAEGLHGDLNQRQRDTVMNNFRNGLTDIFICTDIAARGIDIESVEAVINYDVPQEIEYYVHRVGRTGRAGKSGISHTLCTSRDFKRLHKIEEMCHIKMIERDLPSFEDIQFVQRKAIFNEILEVHQNNDTRNLISPIYSFCKTNRISLEEFAAACLKKEIGDKLMEDDKELALPAKNEKKKRSRKESRNESHKESRKESRKESKKESNKKSDKRRKRH